MNITGSPTDYQWWWQIFIAREDILLSIHTSDTKSAYVGLVEWVIE